MKSKRNFKKNKKNNKNKTFRGGFFSSSNKINPYPGQCDVNQLTDLKTSDEMHKKYKACCPKGMFGTKNSSSYCKQLDLNFQSALKAENDAKDQNTTELPSAQLPQQAYDVGVAESKPWYKFWGGKKSKRKNIMNKKSMNNKSRNSKKRNYSRTSRNK